MAPRCPDGVGPNPASPAITSVFVTSVPTVPGRPVLGIVTPLSAALLVMFAGVSPCAICQMISPLPRSIALIEPYGGFMIGRPLTFSPPPPPPSPPPSAAAAGAAAPAAGAGVVAAPPPAPAVVRAPEAALPWTYCMSFFAGSRGGTRPSCASDLFEDTYRMCVSGSYDPPGQ